MVLKSKYQLKGYLGKNNLVVSIYSASEDITYDVTLCGDNYMIKYAFNSYGSILIFVDRYEIINASGEVIERYDNGVGD